MQMIAKHMIHLWRAENNAQADKRLFDGLCEYRAAQATCFFSFLLICEGNSKIRISKSAKKKMKKIFASLKISYFIKINSVKSTVQKLKILFSFFYFQSKKKSVNFLSV